MPNPNPLAPSPPQWGPLLQEKVILPTKAPSFILANLPWVVFVLWLTCLPASGASTDARGVTLLVQGAGPVSSSSAAEEVWGKLVAGDGGRLRWTGFAGYLVNQHGWKIGGILRAEAERVRESNLDELGAVDAQRADFFILASSLAAQRDGLESRARELASAVEAVRRLTGARAVRLVCYSAGGISARIWLQGAVGGRPYERGSVSHLVTVTTPHLGIGGVVRPASKLWNRYQPLHPSSSLLQRLNQELELPPDVGFTAVVIGDATATIADSGRMYRPYLRLTRNQLRSLPALLRDGHDGVVHSLSAQLHLTPTAARYENRTNRDIKVAVCRPESSPVRTARHVTVHTHAMQQTATWRILLRVLEGKRRGELDQEAERRRWAGQIALDQAERTVAKHVPLTTASGWKLARLTMRPVGASSYRVSWQCDCRLEGLALFASPRSAKATGTFQLRFDRFERPEAMIEAVADFAGED